MHGVAVESYCEQYSHNDRIHYFIQRFSLVVSHHQKYKLNASVRKKERKKLFFLSLKRLRPTLAQQT